MIKFSELLWKPQRATERRSSTSLSSVSENLPEEAPELRQIPVEEVEIRPESRIVLFTDPRSAGADRFRLLRMRLRELKAVSNIRKLLVTSPLPEDGKSTIALNLATALAEGGKRAVLLIEADFYHPTLVQRLGLRSQPGLGECLEGGLDPMSVLRRLEPLGWYLLGAGKAQGDPTELLESDLLLNLMQRFSPYFEWILIDTPPVAPLTDTVSLSKHVDATLLVVRADRTPQEAVKEALSRLGPKKVLGIVFNAAEGLNNVYSEYYGCYGKT
jgi:capsular exopolysaccharide synthesis family protein